MLHLLVQQLEPAGDGVAVGEMAVARWEWYYAEGSYASVGYFNKDIDNYVGVTQIVEQPFDLHTPIHGALSEPRIQVSGTGTTVADALPL